MSIDPSAVIDKTALIRDGAKINARVTVGRHCFIGDQVEIHDDVTIMDNVWIDGQTTIGAGCRIFPFACLGTEPQHAQQQNQGQALEIGSHTVVREYVSIGLSLGSEPTRIGHHAYLMTGVHIGHDCQVADHVIIANYVQIAGSAQIGSRAYLSSMVLVHQFARIGDLAMIGARVTVLYDVPPYALLDQGHPGQFSLNRIGLRRIGATPATLLAIRKTYRCLFAGQSQGFYQRVQQLPATTSETKRIQAFFQTKSARGYCRPVFSDQE